MLRLRSRRDSLHVCATGVAHRTSDHRRSAPRRHRHRRGHVSVLRHGRAPASGPPGTRARAAGPARDLGGALRARGVPAVRLPARQSALMWSQPYHRCLAVLSVTLFFARLAGWLIRAYLTKDTVAAPSGSIFVNLARLLIWAIGITFMLGVLGVQIGPLVASLGVVGLAVSLGLQDTLANFFSGLQITMSRADPARQVHPPVHDRRGGHGRRRDVAKHDLAGAEQRPRSSSPTRSSRAPRSRTSPPTTRSTGRERAVHREVRQRPRDGEAHRAGRGRPRGSGRLRRAVKDFEPACRFRAFGPEGSRRW